MKEYTRTLVMEEVISSKDFLNLLLSQRRTDKKIAVCKWTRTIRTNLFKYYFQKKNIFS